MEIIMQIVVIALIVLFFVSVSLFIRRMVINSRFQKQQLAKLEKEVRDVKALLLDTEKK